ncbi:hypothetical protein Tco_1521117, partial [Tanacetum coccineum]
MEKPEEAEVKRRVSIELVVAFILIVAGVGEELFYRAAVQGALADVFVRGNDLVANAHGMDAP